MTCRTLAVTRGALAGTGVVVVAGAMVVAGLAVAVRAASAGRIVSLDEVPAQPVALVLGAEVYADGTPSRFLRARLDLAAELFRRGKVASILVSGDGATPFYNETDAMLGYLLALGMPADKVVCDPGGLDTYDSIVRAKQDFGVDAAIVVTQHYHLPRAIAICRAVGLDGWGVGDETARSSHRTWRHGTLRELAANVKLAWDLGTRRRPLGVPADR